MQQFTTILDGMFYHCFTLPKIGVKQERKTMVKHEGKI